MSRISSEFKQVLARLRDDTQDFPPADLYFLSSLSRVETEALEAAWAETPVERRRNVMHDLAEIGEADFEVSFEAVFRLALEDDDAEVRAAAIGGLWEVESPDLMGSFLTLLQADPSPLVRAQAASALGRFVYLGEVEELPAGQARRVEAALLQVIQSPEQPEVRRRALEAISFSTRPEVTPLIESAYHSTEPNFRTSAIFAMGRNADERWGPRVIAALDGTDPVLRYEAARAAGELELSEAVSSLSELTEDVDPQVRDAAIWSLGQIGGSEAQAVLTRLLEEADEDSVDYIQEALDNLLFASDLETFDLLEVEEDEDLEDDDEEDDLGGPSRRN